MCNFKYMIPYIGFIFAIIAIAFLLNFIQDCVKTHKSHKNSMSFQAGIDLANIPVVTFYQGDNKYNFLLDTGSSCCHVNKSVLDKLEYKNSNVTNNTIGIEGNYIQTPCCELILEYKKCKFSDTFNVSDLDSTFAAIKEDTGVQLHGILGNSFFTKYQYILDYQNMIAYHTKH